MKLKTHQVMMGVKINDEDYDEEIMKIDEN
jgi:hypothetical protein